MGSCHWADGQLLATTWRVSRGGHAATVIVSANVHYPTFSVVRHPTRARPRHADTPTGSPRPAAAGGVHHADALVRPFSFQTDVSLVLSRAARDSGGTSRPLSSSCSRFLRVTTHPMQTRVAAVALLCVCTGAHAAGIANPEDYVNTLGGSDSKYDLSHGNIMPDLTMPSV